MERKVKNLFEVVADGDDIKLQRILLEGKEERNAATLAVIIKMKSLVLKDELNV